MDRTKREVPEGIRSVEAAISLYGGRVPGRKPDVAAYRSYTEEVRAAKEEARRVKIDMVAASKAKKKSEKEIEASAARVNLYEKCAEELREDIERADEENVLVELARIEAERERKEIEARRGVELTQFSSYMEAAKKKIDGLRSEIDRTKELEVKLAATNSDVITIQNEMEQLRLMGRNSTDKNSLVVVSSAETELNAAKNELRSIKEVAFQFMFSMDLVRQELMQIAQETSRLNKLETEADSKVQNLKSKLLEAKSKLEHASVAGERAKLIISNLSSALQKAEAEAEAAAEEKEVVFKETEAIKAEIEKADLDIKTAEEGIQAAMQGLEAVKASEALAIKKLGHVRERMMRSRASPSPQGSTITISRSEYNYLKKCAEGAKVVAAKKAAAAQAWIEALKAGEKDILMQCEIVEGEIREIEAAKEQEEVAGKDQGPDEEEVANLELAVATPRKSMRENKIPLTLRRAKVRRLSSSSGIMYDPRSPSFAIKKRTKVMPNLPKFLNPGGN